MKMLLKSKKSLLMVLFAALTFGMVSAQTLTESKLGDNISATVKGGITTPLKTPISFAKAIGGLELRKQVTPVFGLGLEGEWTVNTSKWKNQLPNSWVVDHQYIGLFGTANLFTLFDGYKGIPRTFEVETVLGIGWLHAYRNELPDGNCVGSKVGVNVNWNLGKNKAWTVSLKPACVWALPEYNANHGALQVQAGVTYHFKNSNGKHHFTVCDKVATQKEIDVLNDRINRLRKALYISETRPPVVEVREVIKKVIVPATDAVEVFEELPKIQFLRGCSRISSTSIVSLQTIADRIKDSNNQRFLIIGYASTEGNEEYNQILSQSRAENVRNALINCGVNPAQLIAVGKGATKQFGESKELNRVVVATLQ